MVQMRVASTGDPCSCRYTIGLHAESKIQTVYDRNTRRCTIKVYAGIATLAFAREPSAKAKKCKNDVTDTPGIEPATLRVRGVHGVSAALIGLWIGPTYRALTTKLLIDVLLSSSKKRVAHELT